MVELEKEYCYLDGLSTSQAADKMDFSRVSVSRWRSQAIAELADIMNPEDIA